MFMAQNVYQTVLYFSGSGRIIIMGRFESENPVSCCDVSS
jgi:hypothetical protein